MSQTQSLALTYTPLESGDRESRWIRIEQQDTGDESLTVAEAAALIDGLYGIEPCDDGMGGGGEEADPENEPDSDAVDAALAGLLDRAGMCKQPEYWEAVVHVYRSHQTPDYELRSETADVESAVYETVRASHRQDVEANGAVIELAMPYAGGLTGIPAGVGWGVRGSTVNLDRPLNARLVLRYDTTYDRVTLRVPTGSPSPLREGGRPEIPAASVVAFWAELAASCDLNPPDQDDDTDADDIAAICAKGGDGSSVDVKPKDCWQRVTHYDRCNCSRKRVNERTETVPAACDEPRNVEVFGGYVHCEGEEDELSDPEYYQRRCCHAPPAGLPRCRRSYAVYNGGREIESGPDHWRDVYGPDVAMVAVLPKDGRCGDLVTEWNVPSRNCCDDVEPQRPAEDNPTTIKYGEVVQLMVEGGQDPRRWRASAGLLFPDGTNYVERGIHAAWVHVAPDACAVSGVQVDDGCTKVTIPLTLDEEREEMYLSPDEANISPNGYLTVTAYNARGDVQWTAGALRLITPQGLATATFEAPDSFCGSTTIVATDACGDMASAIALSTQGHWEVVKDFDPCNAPWSGLASNWAYGYYVSQGWRANVYTYTGVKQFSKYGCPEEGSCGEVLSDAPCEYGNLLTEGVTINCPSLETKYTWRRKRGELCCQYYSWYSSDGEPGGKDCREIENRWSAVTQWITELQRWECP